MSLRFFDLQYVSLKISNFIAFPALVSKLQKILHVVSYIWELLWYIIRMVLYVYSCHVLGAWWVILRFGFISFRFAVLKIWIIFWYMLVPTHMQVNAIKLLLQFLCSNSYVCFGNKKNVLILLSFLLSFLWYVLNVWTITGNLWSQNLPHAHMVTSSGSHLAHNPSHTLRAHWLRVEHLKTSL